MQQKYPGTYISAPHNGLIYIAELARRGCRKLNFSAMPELPIAADSRVALRSVPLAIRREARAHLLPGVAP
jgi:hypothetical protein